MHRVTNKQSNLAHDEGPSEKGSPIFVPLLRCSAAAASSSLDHIIITSIDRWMKPSICKTTRAASACLCPSLSPLAPDSLLRCSACSPCLPAHFTRLPNKVPNYDEWQFPCQLARSLASGFGRPGQQANNNVPIPPLFSNRVMSIGRSGDHFRPVLVVGLHNTLIV